MNIAATPVWRSPARGTLLECPVWCARLNTLYWVDVVEPAVHSHCFTDGKSTQWPLAKPPGSIALTTGGRLLVALRSGLLLLNPENGAQQALEWDGPALEEDRFNDGATDPVGNFWIGSMDRKLAEPLGRIFRMGAGMKTSAGPIHAKLSNGVCFSPDGAHMYFSRSFEREICRFKIVDGPQMLSDETVIVKFGDDIEGRPDGCTVDAEGNLWSARVGGGAIDRYAPDGSRLGLLKVSTTHPTHCAFGGENMKTLFVSTSRHGEQFTKMNAGRDTDDAGRILAYRVETAGLQPTPFAHAR